MLILPCISLDGIADATVTTQSNRAIYIIVLFLSALLTCPQSSRSRYHFNDVERGLFQHVHIKLNPT